MCETFTYNTSIRYVQGLITVCIKQWYHRSMGECNSIISAHTKYIENTYIELPYIKNI